MHTYACYNNNNNSNNNNNKNLMTQRPGGPISQEDRDNVNQQSRTEFGCKSPWTRSLT